MPASPSPPRSIWRTISPAHDRVAPRTVGEDQSLMDQMSGCNPVRHTANVPMLEKGQAMLGIIVADALRRNRKLP